MDNKAKTLKYLKTKAEPFLEEIMHKLLLSKPQDPVLELIAILKSKTENESENILKNDDSSGQYFDKPLSEDERQELQTLRMKYESIRHETDKLKSAMSSPYDSVSEYSSIGEYSSESSINYGSSYDSPCKSHH